MNQSDYSVSLGFADGEYPRGTHICQIYSDDEERDQSIAQYVRSGLASKERTACFSDTLDRQQLESYLKIHGISLSEAESSGALTLVGVRETYFENNQFSPEHMLERLKKYEIESKDAGCSACRVIGEMTSDIENVEGGHRLLEYESKVSLLLRDHPITTVCQYNARDFDGATIMDVLRVHPLMVVRGSVVNNPLYILPEKILEQQQ